jgi:hypothetical protein
MDKRDFLLRSFCGVLIGFVVLATGSVLGPIAIHAAFPLDSLLEPGRLAPTPLFMGLQLSVAFFEALVAGSLCRTVARTRSPAVVLAAIILCLSLMHALMAIALPNANPTARVGGEPAETVQDLVLAQQPILFTLAGPVVLVAGILLGSYRPRVKS